MPIPTQALRISDAIANQLEQRILEGSLKAGDRLPAERELAAELGVSRPSLREAIQKLVSRGLLASRHGGGTFVTDRLNAPFVDPWQEMLSGHPDLQGDLLEFRHMLEGEAAKLAARRATDLDLQRLDAAHNALHEAYISDRIDDCVQTDVAFHQAIAEASHNALIGHLTASLLRVIHGHVSRNLDHLHQRPLSWRELEAQHQTILSAIRARDSEAAAAAARAHVEFVRLSMEDSARAEERRSRAQRRLG